MCKLIWHINIAYVNLIDNSHSSDKGLLDIKIFLVRIEYLSTEPVV